MKNQGTLEKRFFSTLEMSGGEAMKLLSNFCVAHSTECQEQDRAFYNVLGGVKTHSKKLILDRCLTLIGFHWKKLRPKAEVGLAYEPNTFAKMMQQLFYVFKAKGTQHNWMRDFNLADEFHGQMKEKWTRIRQIDPTFGTMKQRAQFNIDID